MADKTIRELIWGENPLNGIDVQAHPDDTQGWNSTHSFFEPLIKLTQPKLIVEVGTWKGGSAIHMARICKSLGLSTEVVCVDTWLGSPEHFADTKNEFVQSLRYTNGWPNLYYTFASNVIRAGLADQITPLPLPSESAIEVLKRLNASVDLIHIDGAHEYEPALRDIACYWEILRPEGVMICDDYAGWPGVTKAVNEFFGQQGVPIYSSFGKAFARKGGNCMFELDITVNAELGR